MEIPTTPSVKRLMREPLVHFLVLGALLFAVSHWRGDASNRIVITPGQIDSMAATFARTWQRPPTEQELKGLVDDYVREELATREAGALGLDRDDVVIRRRLRQKLEFLIEDSPDAAPVTDTELRTWLERHADRYRFEPEVAFRQVYVSPDRRGDATERDAKILLAKLSADGSDVATDIGDRLMVPRDVELSARSSIARQFGEEFAAAVLQIEPGHWAGPVRSGYGLHLVWVHTRDGGRMPALEEVRPQVERDVFSARRRERMEQMYAEMLSRYTVVMEKRRTDPQNGAGSAAGRGLR
jgi:PPIC-type PPIASE domain